MSEPSGSADSSSAAESAARMELFVRLSTQHQRRLYLYIFSQLPRWADADDVLQETNVVLWSKFAEFEPESNFYAWACRIAEFEIRRYRQRKSREGMRFFSETVTEELAALAESRQAELDARQDALAECLGKLAGRDRELIGARYANEQTPQQLAEATGRSVDAIYKALRRVHDALFDCVRRAMNREANS